MVEIQGLTGTNPLFLESPIGHVILDLSGRIIDVNPSGCKAFARPLDRLIGSNLLDHIHTSDQKLFERQLDEVQATGSCEWKARIRRGDGLPRLLRYRGIRTSELLDEECLILFVQAMADQGLGRPEAAQLQDLLKTLPGHFFITTDKVGKIRHSSGLERTHFLDSSSVLGTSYRMLLGGERDGEENYEELLSEVTSGRPWAGVQWHRRKDGPSFPAKIFAAPQRVPNTGQIVGMLLIGQNDFEVHRWRDQAERAEPLAQIGSLSTGIAQKISEALSNLEETVFKLDFPTSESSGEAETIRAEITHFRRFLEAVAEFGNRGTLRRQPFPLMEALSDSLAHLDDRAKALGVEPRVDGPSDLPDVYADKSYLTRILEILLENSLDALEGTPNPFLRVSLSNGEDGVLVKVSNSSAVLKEEWLAEIFDPFFTTKEGRPGLGLAVAQGMVRAHDGRLWAEMPEPGMLSLTLELPREAPFRVREFRPLPLNLSRARRVLLVDDHEARRVGTRGFLEELGYKVQEAWSARSAVAEITNGRLPEIVITDLMVSDGSGSWLLDELSRLAPELVRRTILLTENPEYEAAKVVSQERGCVVVRKPVEATDLLEVLDSVALVA
jgi:signal transduction histidine kinase/CheY-like chemotaxis protein